MSAAVSVSYYVGLDVHRKIISYCVKTSDGRIVRESHLPLSIRLNSTPSHEEIDNENDEQ